VLGMLLVVVPQLVVIHRVCRVSRMGFPKAHRRALVGTLLGGLLLLVGALRGWGAKEVHEAPGAILFLTALGGVWSLVVMALFPWLGLSLRDDAMERRNTAALVALLGALLAVQLTFIGGNIGEGPSYWNNVFCAVLGTGGLLCLWLALEVGGGVSASIAEDRDLASGVRLCGFLVAAGLILGRAVAGSWQSEAATLRDYVHDGWPAGGLGVLALIFERRLRPSQQRPFPAWPVVGLLPALLCLGLAGAWVYHVGPWEGFAR